MQPVRNVLVGLLFLALVLAVIVTLFASAAIVLAVLGPFAGLSYLTVQLRKARALWRSEGRIPIAGGFRIVGTKATRNLALSHAIAGVGGLLLGAAPAAFLLGGGWGGVLLLVSGIIVGAWAGTLAYHVRSTMSGVDVLPPDV